MVQYDGHMKRPGPRLRARQVPQLSVTCAAWLGGIVDGEGHVSFSGTPQLIVQNTEFELIATLLRVVGAGGVQYKQRRGYKPSLRWVLGTQWDILYVLHAIAPFSVKAQEALPRLAARLQRLSSPPFPRRPIIVSMVRHYKPRPRLRQTCLECRQPLTGRADQLRCSEACRQRAKRARLKP